MFNVWDVSGQPAQFNWRRVGQAPGTDSTNPYREELRERGQVPVERPDVGDEEGSRRRSAVDAYRRVQSPPDERAQREPAVTAEQIMSSPVVTLPDSATLAQAWESIQTSGFRHLPILNEDERLVGILSERDLLRAAGTPDRIPRQSVRQQPVRELMKGQVFSARPEAPIRELARVMFDEKIGAMPIFDDTWKLVGIVTRADILRALVHRAPVELWI